MAWLLPLLLSVADLVTEAAYCHGSPSPDAKPNLFPIITAEPKLVKSVKNGRLYDAGLFDVVHLYGTPYEMGAAHAALKGEEVSHLSF